MTIVTEEELSGLKKVGEAVARTLAGMIDYLQPGITTAELDRLGEELLKKYGARSAPKLVYNFPGATCISVNNQVAHGIPGLHKIKRGDLINIDVSAELNGYFADTGASVPVGRPSLLLNELCACARRALHRAIETAGVGVPINAIGRVIEQEAYRAGFTVIKNLCGHGLGRTLHEEPVNILNFYYASDQRQLQEGQVIAIEPFISTGPELVDEAGDGWTLTVPRGSLVAQFEHTVVIAKNKPVVITQLQD